MDPIGAIGRVLYGRNRPGSRSGDRASRLALALVAVLLASPTSTAQELPGLSEAEEAPVEASQVRPEAIEARSDELAGELAATERAIVEARNGPSRAHLEEVARALRGIDALLRQQASLALPATDPEPASRPLPEAAAPSLFALDQLYEAQFQSEQEALRRADALAASREALSVAKQRLDEAEKRRRDARNEFELAKGVAAKSSAEWHLELRRLASRTAQERVHLKTLELGVAQRVAEQEGDDAALAQRIAQMREALSRGEGEPEGGFAALSAREEEIRSSRESAERRLATVELRLEAARRRFAQQADPPDALLGEIETISLERDAIHQEIELGDAQMERLASLRETWKRWDAALRSRASREDLETWKGEIPERSEALAQTERRRRGKVADLERQLAALQDRLRVPADGGAVRATLEEQREILTRRLDAERNETAELARDQRLFARLRAEIETPDPLEYLAATAESARDLWRYEITAVDDSAITVGSLVLALLLAAAGLWVSRRGSGWIGRVSMDRFKLDAGAANALQTLSFYVLLVSFTLLALRAVHFPLTAFTVLGGALAIGIGFGSQNVMNNFISGLILMLERPVRARDIIEVDGNHGTIERIGARSTQIRSQDGRHIIVPNSFFLESNVVNWTLSDDLIRTSVKVGVVYGSPTRLVEELIGRVVAEEERILPDPAPVIIFDEFGDNSLNFEAHFWVRARSPMAMRVVQSRVRFRIDELFREHELVIAFPQRDVHLDSVAPIEVRVVGAGDRSNFEQKTR